MNRRVLVVLLGLALVTSGFMNLQVKFSTAPNGVNVILLGERNQGPWPLAVPVVLGQQMALAGYVWTLLTILAAAPMLVATLERGWLEVIFSKGAARSTILLGRFSAGVSLYVLLAVVSTAPLGIRLWWVTHLPTWQIGVAVLIQVVGFTAILSVAALASLLQKGVALPIMAAAGVWYVSLPLATRQENYYPYVQSELGRWIIDWVYYILPKSAELERVSSVFIQFSTIPTSWPLWTTVLFTAGVLGLTTALLERKSF
jgi:ABC-type transport system involved in multi-copper enzyme maturation permease subunit